MLALLPIIELAINTLLSLLKAQGVTGTDYSSLASGLEAAIGPLLGLIGQKGTGASTIVLTSLATSIGVLNALAQDPKLPADQLAKVKEYLVAAQNATTAWLSASKGYDPTTLDPVQPIA